MNTIQPSNSYERRIWIELIGFDNTHEDCGVQAYLDTIGFVPDVLSILFSTPDIIHQHDGFEEEVEFPPDFCSYTGHERSAERERQVWTNWQLRRLVSELRRHGVKVFLSTFTTKIRYYYLPQEPRLEWAESHRELLEVNKFGEATPAIAPLKRFADGTYYEDFLIPRLAQTLSDYEFDGWHAADGWGPLRMPIYEGDFSDDVFDQFVRDRQVEIPSHIKSICDNHPEEFLQRAEWVWSAQRRNWIDFYTERWAAFYRKKVAALKAINKEIVINSAWTRDPFEAIYRYGVDYRKIIAAGVDGIVTESLAAACDMQAEGGDRLHEFTAALLLTRGAVPQTDLFFLLGIKDTMEQWDVLRHAAPAFETELLVLADLHFRNETGTLSRCANGFVGCLADAVLPHEWKWMEQRWKLAFDAVPSDITGCTLVWSDSAFDSELDDFLQHRSPTTLRLLQGLLARGAEVNAVTRIENLESVRGPLLVLNSHLFSVQELSKIEAYSRGAAFTISRENSDGTSPNMRLAWRDGDDSGYLAWPGMAFVPVAGMMDPAPFLVDLPMQELPDTFFKDCAARINENSRAPIVIESATLCHVRAALMPSGEMRTVVENHGHAYTKVRVDVRKAIESIKVVSEFPVHAVPFQNSEFVVKVPGRGSVVLDISFGD